MLNLRSSELANAAELRARAMPQRVATVGFLCVLLHMAFAWPLVWLWGVAYIAVSAIEVLIARRFVSRLDGDRAGSGLTYVASIVLSATVYGSLTVPLLLLEHAHDGEVIGVVLLAGGLLSGLTVSRTSLAAYAATAAPMSAYLLLNPFLAYAFAVDTISWATVAAVLMVLAQAYAAWVRYGGALSAEAAARAESDRRRGEAEAADNAKSAFVATICHELRTPLSGVMAAAAQLQKEPHGRSETDREAVEVLADAGAFMKTLLDDLLDLAKLEAGRMTVEAVRYDLGELIWKLERHWSSAARAAGKPLQLTAALNLPVEVSGDPTRLRQILNNLLSNALKFTGEGGVTWSVEGQEDGELWWLEMRVTDTGPGIPADKLARLFTPFDQTDDSVARTHGGTGLGLALSRELARLMGGELAVESRPGKGSTFVLTVPVRRLEPETALRNPEVDAPAAQRRGGVRVLVVDDHIINRRTAALLLEAGGAEVSSVESGEEALALLDAEPFDVVLSDLHMPGINGLALTRAIRERTGLNRSVPVVALSGADSPEDLAACRAAGMRGCVSKPIDPRLLSQAIEEACAGRPPASDRAEVA